MLRKYKKTKLPTPVASTKKATSSVDKLLSSHSSSAAAAKSTSLPRSKNPIPTTLAKTFLSSNLVNILSSPTVLSSHFTNHVTPRASPVAALVFDKENQEDTNPLSPEPITIKNYHHTDYDEDMDLDYQQQLSKWNTKTTREEFEDNGGLLVCSRRGHFLDAENFDIKNHLTGECYAQCKRCRAHVVEEDAKAKTDIDSKLRKMCHNAIQSDKIKTKGSFVSKINDVFPIVQKLWQEHDGECCYCHRIGLVCLAESGDMMASLEATNSRLPHFHPDQELKICCIMCNWAKKEFTQRNFLQFLGKIKSNANTPYQHTPITSEDVTRIKTMRKDNYAKMERNWLALKCVVGGLCKIEGTLATANEFVAVAREAGKMCPLTKIVCLWTKESNLLKLGFNRKKNIEGTRSKPTIKYSHSKDNIEVRMSILNRAQNLFGEDSLVRWVRSIQENFVV